MSNTKSQILSKVATLLDKFSDRLVNVARQTRQNTDAVAALRDEVRLKAERAVGIAVEAKEKAERAHLALIYQGESIDKLKKEAEDREGRQTLRDQNNVQSLTNLRDSTQKGFDQVRQDVESLLKTIQRLNERVGQVESQVALAKVGPSAIDQQTVNSKLAGVYDVTADLDRRVQELEKANARAELKKAYPLVLELMNNPSFTKYVVKAGHAFNPAAILKAITET